MNPPYRALSPGATIAVIAPASPATDEALARAPAVIETMGYTPRLYPGCFARNDYLAGDDDCRLADLHAAFAADDVAAVLCLRGGYGSGRLLERIDRRLLFAEPKPLIGYSDITVLHAQFSNAGIASFHGPMLTSDLLDVADPMTQCGLACLRDGLPFCNPIEFPVASNHRDRHSHPRLCKSIWPYGPRRRSRPG